MRVVAFEGIDRAGKTSLLRAVARITTHRFVFADRLLVTHRVYDQYFGRDPLGKREVFYRRLEASLVDLGFVVVFVDETPRVCLERGAWEQYTETDLLQQSRMFYEAICRLPSAVARIHVVPNGRLVYDLAVEVAEELCRIERT